MSTVLAEAIAKENKNAATPRRNKKPSLQAVLVKYMASRSRASTLNELVKAAQHYRYSHKAVKQLLTKLLKQRVILKTKFEDYFLETDWFRSHAQDYNCKMTQGFSHHKP